MVKHEPDNIKVKLLEWISQTALTNFKDNWFTDTEIINKTFWALELKNELKWVNIVWIRSRTKLSEEILKDNTDLLAIWCFCIGTNQVDLLTAKKRWIPVFNSPFSNTRSVAELIIADIVMLMRWVFYRSVNAHNWVWLKNAKNSFEIKWKTLWIVWYGHIWTQVSILAEAMWMKVVYFDVINRLPIWNACKVNTLNELLSMSDVVTLHVPWLKSTVNLIWEKEFDAMKNGSYLINLSRWNVVDIKALKKNLDSGKILWAAIDVFPEEPKTNDDMFVSELQWNYNVILTPHVGWSTQEAQNNIWIEVSENLIKYIKCWDTIWSVNFPQMSVSEKDENSVRIQHIHENIPWILAQINKIFGDDNINILSESLKTDETIGYCIFDVEKISKDTLVKLKNIKWTIKTRII